MLFNLKTAVILIKTVRLAATCVCEQMPEVTGKGSMFALLCYVIAAAMKFPAETAETEWEKTQ